MAGDLTLLQKLFNLGNDLLHLPIVEWLAHYCVWGFHLAAGPAYLVAFIGVAIWDVISGSVFWTYDTPKGRTVLVTGCDSGFGHELVLALGQKGWKVYAGCLSEKGIQSLTDKYPGLIPVKLDVTKADEIKAVVEKVDRENPQGLYALVNNAGVGVGGVIDWAPMEDYRFIMEVNFFAVVAMTKACLPLLKKAEEARIVNVGSIAGIFFGSACMSGYSASKHACEAFTAALRSEMIGWGIKVVGVNPSFHRTNIATHAADSVMKTYNKLDPVKKAEYGDDYAKACYEVTDNFTSGCWDPKNVLDALVHATTGHNPRLQYLVGSDAKFMLSLLIMLPVRVYEPIVQFLHLSKLVPAAKKAKKAKDA